MCTEFKSFPISLSLRPGVGQNLSNYYSLKEQEKLQLTVELHDLPEVADLDDGPGRGAVPGVLVDEKEDDLLQTHRHLAENLAHVVRQLK